MWTDPLYFMDFMCVYWRGFAEVSTLVKPSHKYPFVRVVYLIEDFKSRVLFFPGMLPDVDAPLGCGMVLLALVFVCFFCLFVCWFVCVAA